PKASNGTPKANDTPKAPKAGDGIESEYTLQDGRGPFADVQSALDASGVDKAQRPKHNRYDRLSAVWQAKIIRKVKGSTEAGKAGTTEATEAGITEATEAGTNGKGTTSEAIELVASAK
ncbi:MAG: hypothetical protein Q8P59_12075, partial [Dehalococcoidia bacterium]|nr:hypothetical protein [Dehalococcoidia bacterium]